MEKRVAVVLSGGGAKGAYEIGVWKALRKLKINYDIVTGTSVGALNGAFMVQGDYKQAQKMWENINFDMIFKDGFQGNVNTFDGVKKLISMYGKGVLKGGLDVSKLEETINTYINPTKFYRSRIKYGLVTVNLSTLKPIRLVKENIPESLLKDYLMASATCFPAFKTKQIENQYYVDGGYSDNLPISLAVELGATEVIAVDIGGKKIFQSKTPTFDIPITHIKPRNEIGSFLVFDKSLATRNIKLGFNDTMKIFGKYEGNQLTFKKGEIDKLVKIAFPKMKRDLQNIIDTLDHNKVLLKELQVLDDYRFLLENEKEFKNEIKTIIETLGLSFGIDETVIYQKGSYYKAIKTKYNEIGEIDFEMIKDYFEENKLNKSTYENIVIKYGYELLQNIWNQKLPSPVLFMKQEFLSSLYLKTILG